jgi:hypothetical protein
MRLFIIRADISRKTMSAGADPQAAKTIQTSLKDLMKSLRRYEECRKSSLSSLEAVNSTHAGIQAEEKLTPTAQAKLLKQYQEVRTCNGG